MWIRIRRLVCSGGGGGSGAEQVVLLNQVIQVSLWKSQNWTEQGDCKKYLRKDCSSCRKALNLGHIWHVWITTRRTIGSNRVGEEHSWWYIQKCYFWSLWINDRDLAFALNVMDISWRFLSRRIQLFEILQMVLDCMRTCPLGQYVGRQSLWIQVQC